MFDIAPTELLVVAIVALVFIGPKELPGVMRVVGQWVGRARGMARHFRSGIDTMIRESELEEMEKKWREENERIMREFPTADAVTPPIAGPDAPPADPNAATAAAADDAPAAPEQAMGNWGEYDPPAPPPAGPPAEFDEKRELP